MKLRDLQIEEEDLLMELGYEKNLDYVYENSPLFKNYRCFLIDNGVRRLVCVDENLQLYYQVDDVLRGCCKTDDPNLIINRFKYQFLKLYPKNGKKVHAYAPYNTQNEIEIVDKDFSEDDINKIKDLGFVLYSFRNGPRVFYKRKNKEGEIRRSYIVKHNNEYYSLRESIRIPEHYDPIKGEDVVFKSFIMQLKKLNIEDQCREESPQYGEVLL